MTHRAVDGAARVCGAIRVAVRELHARMEPLRLALVERRPSSAEHVGRSNAEVLDAMLTRDFDELVERRERLDTAHA